MSGGRGAQADERILFLSPSQRDAQVVQELLCEHGFSVRAFSDMDEFCEEIERGAGALVLAEEALTEGAPRPLAERLARQPAWSDVPLLFLARPRQTAGAMRILEALGHAGNVTLFERPLHGLALMSALRVALRARRRQYGMRDFLTERARLLESERAARDEAERTSSVKDEFLAMLSHELRTPLSAVLGWTQLAKHKADPSSDMGKALEVIERNARVQSQLIEDLLDMSRIAAGKVTLELSTVSLDEVLDSTVAALLPSAQVKGVRLEQRRTGGPALVRGDRVRLQQVASNLLANAVKFTPAGGRVEAGVDSAGDLAILTVSDDGQGIATNFLPLVFDHFRQGDASTARRHSGLGLGLSIVKRLVELHGGTVRAASAGEGKGATFTVVLPALADPAPGSAPQDDSAPGGAAERRLAGVHVLVVDDEPDALELARRVLEQEGASVRTADSAAAALDKLADELPHVIVSDIAMPAMDGYALMERVRALDPERGGRIPAVALTAFVGPRDKGRARAAGYSAHIAKPFEPAALVEAVRAASRRGPASA
jgi:signal transduction histidine kinase/ActR/RegA family two-component response regulator